MEVPVATGGFVMVVVGGGGGGSTIGGSTTGGCTTGGGGCTTTGGGALGLTHSKAMFPTPSGCVTVEEILLIYCPVGQLNVLMTPS